MPAISGSTTRYLADLSRTESQIQQAQTEISSGFAIQNPSDSPAQISELLQLEADIGQNEQVQSNLGSVSSELQTADSALQTASQVVDSAVSLGTQGANSTATAQERANIAQQVSGILQTLVSISNTTFNGRYIFSGDQDTQAAYTLDSTQPEGVRQIATGSATRTIVGSTGTTVSVAKTAQEIFDARNPDGSPAAGNVFNAVNSLLTALQNNDQAGISQAVTSLQAASSYLNGQIAFYGAAENNVASASDLAQKFQTQQQSELSQIRDADIPTVAVRLNQQEVQQQASLSVEASILQNKNLFNFLA